MKSLKHYQELWNLTDKEYIYLLECCYFGNNDRIKTIENGKYFGYVTIPDEPRYNLWFKEGKRISEKEAYDIILWQCKNPDKY